MRGRFRHATHIVRVATLFAVGFAVFLVARRVFVPTDFGTLGFYRAGAIDDVRVRPITFAGRAACEECHTGQYWAENVTEAPADPEKDNRHSTLPCEACHAPMAFHAVDQQKPEMTGNERPVPKVAADSLCLGCHRQITGRPAHQPQVVFGVHENTRERCESCHKPHRPRAEKNADRK